MPSVAPSVAIGSIATIALGVGAIYLAEKPEWTLAFFYMPLVILAFATAFSLTGLLARRTGVHGGLFYLACGTVLPVVLFVVFFLLLDLNSQLSGHHMHGETFAMHLRPSIGMLKYTALVMLPGGAAGGLKLHAAWHKMHWAH